MKIFRLSIIFLLLSITIIKAEPYKPKPILFIHGIDGNSKCWGVSPVKISINGIIVKSDSIDKDSIIDGRILPVCLEKLLPMVWNNYKWEKEHGISPTYTPDPDSTPAYPNKSFLEIINFDDNCGSVNPKGSWPDRYSSPTYNGEGQELAARIRSVLGGKTIC